MLGNCQRKSFAYPRESQYCSSMIFCLRKLTLATGALALSSCIQFEREIIQYRHVPSTDELRMTLQYEGISGGKASPRRQAEEQHAPKTLSPQQIAQFESVLKGGRAFFFENWIFEYDRSSIRETLRKLKASELKPDDLTVGEPEKNFLHATLEDIELNNLGFYLDETHRLCGTQTIVIKEFSKFLKLTNETIRRQVSHNLERQRERKGSPSKETIALLSNACNDKHDFLIVEKGRLVVRVPLAKREYLEFKRKVLDENSNPDNPSNKGLPPEIKVTYENQMLTLVLGDGKHGIVSLTKKCHPGYSDNALEYLRENHSKLLLDETKITSAAKRFLTGGD